MSLFSDESGHPISEPGTEMLPGGGGKSAEIPDSTVTSVFARAQVCCLAELFQSYSLLYVLY